MSEGVERQPLIEAEPAKPLESPGVPRSERARTTGYRRRFAYIYGALALIAGIAIGALLVLLTRPDAVPNPAWSAWEPSGSSNARVKQIADHVAKEYRFQGEQMVVALGGPPTVPGDVYARAVRWLRTSGERAVHADTPRRAALLFTEALAILDANPACEDQGCPDDRVELLLARSGVYGELREMVPARNDAEAAHQLLMDVVPLVIEQRPAQ